MKAYQFLIQLLFHCQYLRLLSLELIPNSQQQQYMIFLPAYQKWIFLEYVYSNSHTILSFHLKVLKVQLKINLGCFHIHKISRVDQYLHSHFENACSFKELSLIKEEFWIFHVDISCTLFQQHQPNFELLKILFLALQDSHYLRSLLLQLTRLIYPWNYQAAQGIFKCYDGWQQKRRSTQNLQT